MRGRAKKQRRRARTVSTLSSRRSAVIGSADPFSAPDGLIIRPVRQCCRKHNRPPRPSIAPSARQYVLCPRVSSDQSVEHPRDGEHPAEDGAELREEVRQALPRLGELHHDGTELVEEEDARQALPFARRHRAEMLRHGKLARGSSEGQGHGADARHRSATMHASTRPPERRRAAWRPLHLPCPTRCAAPPRPAPSRTWLVWSTPPCSES